MSIRIRLLLFALRALHSKWMRFALCAALFLMIVASGDILDHSGPSSADDSGVRVFVVLAVGLLAAAVCDSVRNRFRPKH